MQVIRGYLGHFFMNNFLASFENGKYLKFNNVQNDIQIANEAIFTMRCSHGHESCIFLFLSNELNENFCF